FVPDGIPESLKPKPKKKRTDPLSIIALVIVSLVGSVMCFMFANGDSRSSPSSSSSVQVRATQRPTSRPVAQSTASPIRKNGRGDNVVSISKPNEPMIAIIKHTGSSNIIVTAWDGDRRQGLVNEIGNYNGTVALDFDGQHTDEIEVQADGSWTINIQSISSAPAIYGSKSGTGDAVLIVGSLSSPVDVSHTGDSNFIVTVWGNSRSGMVNEIGDYNGTVRLPGSAIVLEIIADGRWSISD
ncbi:MAG: hypothetical protein ACPG8W_15505, partial [Candidatus Promineifilaceae bacterium]